MDSELRRQTLADLLHRSAKRFPNKTAIICGNTTLSYATFDALCNRLATGLAARGTRVAILSRNSHAFAALRFALAWLGAVLIPINFMLKAEEAGFILRHAGAEMLATDRDSTNGLRAAAAAGMVVTASPNREYPPEPDALALAALVIESLDELTPGAIESAAQRARKQRASG